MDEQVVAGRRDRKTGRGRRRLGGRLVLVLASMGALVAVASPAKAAPDAPLDPKRIFAQSEPATVMILADFSADTVVPSLQANTAALQAELANEVQGGQVPADPQSLLNRSIQLIVEHPDVFITAGPSRQAKAGFQATGSGFIIDETGYVVTNAHVAAPHDDEIKQQLAEVGLKSLVEEDAKSMQTELAASGLNLSGDLFQKLVQADATFIGQHLQVANLQKKFSAILGANIPGVTTQIAQVPGDVVAAGDPIPGRDVAIMKLEQKNLPTLPLGDDAPLRPGDRLYVLGYPGAATFHPLISKESITEPSFTAGTLSARKVSTGGFEVLQTDAAITHGNSGGPVFDEHGKVVGIATFGSIGQDNKELGGFNFIMPATLIKQFVDRSGAHPKESLFSTLYEKGLDQEAAGKAKLALATFTQINQMSPGHPYVQQHIASDQSLTASGKGGASDSSGKTGLYAAIGGAAASLVLGAVLLMRRKGNQVVPVGGIGSASYTTPMATALPPSGGPSQAQAVSAPPTAPMPTMPAESMMSHPAATSVAAAAAFCGGCGRPLEGHAFCAGCGRPA